MRLSLFNDASACPLRFSRTFAMCIVLVLVASFPLLSATSSNASTVEVSEFGVLPSGKVVKRYTMKNSKGVQLSVIEYGATIVEIMVPDSSGETANVVLGSDSLDDYIVGFPAASVVGRYANRIRNAEFVLDGETVHVTKNAGVNHIHGGDQNFSRVLWTGSITADSTYPSVTFRYHSADGEEGFPGNLDVAVTYGLKDDNGVHIHYAATTDQATVINLTNHAYFNLAGPGGDVLNHELQIHSNSYTVSDSNLIPTGKSASVVDTPLDFREPRRIGERIGELANSTNGYDHNFVLEPSITLRMIAKVTDPRSGRVLECLTTEPGVQLYTANHFNGNPFPKFGAFCLETQHFPDSPNRPEFPSTVLRPGQAWESTTEYRFTH